MTFESKALLKKERLLGDNFADNVSHGTNKSRVSKMSSLMLQMNSPNISNIKYEDSSPYAQVVDSSKRSRINSFAIEEAR